MSKSSVNLTKPALMKEWAPITLNKKSKQALQQKRHLLDKAMLDLPLMSSQLSIQKQQIETELLELEIYVDWVIAKSGKVNHWQCIQLDTEWLLWIIWSKKQKNSIIGF